MYASKTRKTRLIISILLLLVTSIFILPLLQKPVFAAECGGVTTSLLECDGETADGSTIRDILMTIVNAITIGMGILAVIGIAVVGIQYLTAGGNEQQVTKAKRRLFNIVLGVVVFVALFGILKWLLPGQIFGDVNVERVSFNQKGINLDIGDTKSLQVSVYPLDAKSDNLTYTSDNANVATVDSSGKIVAKSPGTATITVTAPSGAQSSATITVKDPQEATTSNNKCYDPSNPSKNKELLEITLIGDSQSVAAENELKAKFPNSFFSMVGSRSYGYGVSGDTGGGIYVLERVINSSGTVPHYTQGAITNINVDKSSLKKNVVWELGTNAPVPVTEEMIEKVVGMVGKEHNLILVTPLLPSSYGSAPEQLAQMYRNIASRHNNVYIADWNETVKKDVGRYVRSASDYHPSSSGGTQLLADLIYNATIEANKCK